MIRFIPHDMRLDEKINWTIDEEFQFTTHKL